MSTPAQRHPAKPIWKRWYAWVGALLALAIIGGLTGQLDQPQQQAVPTKAPAPHQSKAPAPTCEQVPPAKVDGILQGAKDNTLTPVRSAAVKSADTGNYFIAIRVKHDTGEDDGVWQSPKLDNGMVGSVNAFAKGYTNWPNTKNTGAKTEKEALDCIK